MQDAQEDIMELLLSKAGQYQSTEDSLKDIEKDILELRAERGRHPEHSGSISATLQSLEQLREGYLNLVEEEAKDGERVMPELNRWPAPVRDYDLAAVVEG